jgi:hypothetical protein
MIAISALIIFDTTLGRLNVWINVYAKAKSTINPVPPTMQNLMNDEFWKI